MNAAADHTRLVLVWACDYFSGGPQRAAATVSSNVDLFSCPFPDSSGSVGEEYGAEVVSETTGTGSRVVEF